MIRDLPSPALDGRPDARGRGLWGRLKRAARHAGAMLRRWHELARERRQLAELDERMLKDLGLSRADVEREAGRPFWDVPVRTWPDRR
jgi:uncharacterized protein YjiS (DUF1127 family)